MAEAAEPEHPVGPPALAEAGGWVGFALDDVDGVQVGRVHSVFVDSDSGEPAWVIGALERRGLLRRRSLLVAVPARDCAGAAGRVWTALPRGSLFGSPVVDPGRPLLREHELSICSHYGIGERVGRAAEVAGRPAGTVTSQPA
ncbi:MAG TPA: hypothetical protein VFZ41_04550 [Solirubrobacterales bacterium]